MLKHTPTVSLKPVNKLAYWKGLTPLEYRFYFMRCPICGRKIHHRSEYQETDFPDKPFEYWAKCLDLHLWYDHILPSMVSLGLRPPKKSFRWRHLDLINKEREKALEGLWTDPRFSKRVKKTLAREISYLPFVSKEVISLSSKVRANPEKPGDIVHLFIPDEKEVENLLSVHPWARSRGYVAYKRASAVAKNLFQFRISFLFNATAGFDFIPNTDLALESLKKAVPVLLEKIRASSEKAYELWERRGPAFKNERRRYLFVWNLLNYHDFIFSLSEKLQRQTILRLKKSSFPFFLSLILSGVKKPSEVLSQMGNKYFINFFTAISIEGLKEKRTLKEIKLKEIIDIIPAPLGPRLAVFPEDWRNTASVLDAVFIALNKNLLRREDT